MWLTFLLAISVRFGLADTHGALMKAQSPAQLEEALIWAQMNVRQQNLCKIQLRKGHIPSGCFTAFPGRTPQWNLVCAQAVEGATPGDLKLALSRMGKTSVCRQLVEERLADHRYRGTQVEVLIGHEEVL